MRSIRADFLVGDAGIEPATPLFDVCISRRFEGRDNPIGGGPQRTELTYASYIC
jgi:hypothetical protein